MLATVDNYRCHYHECPPLSCPILLHCQVSRAIKTTEPQHIGATQTPAYCHQGPFLGLQHPDQPGSCWSPAPDLSALGTAWSHPPRSIAFSLVLPFARLIWPGPNSPAPELTGVQRQWPLVSSPALAQSRSFPQPRQSRRYIHGTMAPGVKLMAQHCQHQQQKIHQLSPSPEPASSCFQTKSI